MTTYPVGSREQVVIAPESTYGDLGTNTFASEGWIIGYNVQIIPNFSRGLQEITNNGSDSLELISLEPGAELYSFQMRFNPYDFRWLKYCPTHSEVTDTDNTTYYTHDFSTSGSDVKSFAMQWLRRQNTNQIIELYGCVITGFTLEWTKGTGQKDSFLSVNATCIAKRKVDATSFASVSSPSVKPYKFQEIKLTFDGAEVKELNSGSLGFSTGINAQDSLYAYSDNTSTIGQPIPLKKRYTMNLNINSSDQTFWDKWDGQSISGLSKLEILRDTNDEAIFTFTNLYLDPAPIGETNTEGISASPIVGIPTTIGVQINDGNPTY